MKNPARDVPRPFPVIDGEFPVAKAQDYPVGTSDVRRTARRRLFDRHAPVDAVFLGRIVAGRLVVGAAIVPDDDVSLAPAVAVLALGLDHKPGQLVDQRVALLLLEALDAEDLARIEVQPLPPRLRMDADDGMEDGGPVAVLLVEERRRLPASAVGEGALPSFEPRLDAGRQGLVGGVHAGEERVATPARNGESIELRRLERLLVVGAVGGPSLRAATADGHVELAVRTQLVDAEHGDLGMLGVARGL